jgi:uncharacterized membrane protein YtjA (UPF0391 family)
LAAQRIRRKQGASRETAKNSRFVSYRKSWHARCSCVLQAQQDTNLRLEENVMLHWAIVFFVVALIAALFGFGGIAASAVGIAKVLFFLFLILAVVAFLFGRRASI